MQRLTAAPRDGLTEEQVTALLLADSLEVSGGCELLNPDLMLVEDISDDLAACTVERQMLATQHGTVTLALSRELAWGTALVRPYTVLTSGGVTARFNLGVFSLATPQRKVGTSLPLFDVTGYDRLYLLDRPVGDSYTVPAGTSYLTAVRNAITAAGLTGVLLDGTSTATLPTARVWPLVPEQGEPGTTTWLNIVNDLLAAAGYRGVYADQDGLFRSEPYVAPSARAPEWTFRASGLLADVGQDRTLTRDTWAVPNRWVFINRTLAGDPPPAPATGAGIYTVNDLTSPLTGQAARGLVWPKVVTLEAADQAALVVQGDRIVSDDLRVTGLLEFETSPMPLAGHADVATLVDHELGSVKVTARSWRQDVTGGDTTWVFELV